MKKILILSIIAIVLLSGCTGPKNEIQTQIDDSNVKISEETTSTKQTELPKQTEIPKVGKEQKYFVLNSFNPFLNKSDDRGGIFMLNYSTNLEGSNLKVLSPDGDYKSSYLDGSTGATWKTIRGPEIKLPGNYNVIVDLYEQVDDEYKFVTYYNENFSYKGGKLSIVNLSINGWSKTPGPTASNPLWWIDSMSIWVKNSGDLPSYARIHSKKRSPSGDSMMTFTIGTQEFGWVDAGETKLFKLDPGYSLDGIYWVDVSKDQNKREETFPFEIYLISYFDKDNQFYYTSENPYKIVSLWDSNYLLLDTYSGTINVIIGQPPSVSGS